MKFSLIASVAAVSAQQQQIIEPFFMGIPPVGMSFEQPKPVKTIEQNTWCPNYDKSGDLEDFVMIRKIYYTIWNSMVKGFYKSAK